MDWAEERLGFVAVFRLLLAWIFAAIGPLRGDSGLSCCAALLVSVVNLMFRTSDLSRGYFRRMIVDNRQRE